MQKLTALLCTSFLLGVLPVTAFRKLNSLKISSFVTELILNSLSVECVQYSATLDEAKNSQRQLQSTSTLFMKSTPGLAARLNKFKEQPRMMLTVNSKPQEFNGALIQVISLLKAFGNEHVKKTCEVPRLTKSLEQLSLDMDLEISVNTCKSIQDADSWTKDYGCARLRGRIAGRSMAITLPTMKVVFNYLEQLLDVYEQHLTSRLCSESS